jgi:protein SCO1/2
VPPGDESYPLVGRVVSIDRDTGRVAIRHEEIPGFMPAMTMPFDLAGNPVLDELQPGDTIQATLRVHGTGSTLTNVFITELAEPTDASPPPLPLLEAGTLVPDFTLTTQDDASIQLAQLRGKAVAMTFIYTRCPLPDFCPLMDRRFAELARRVRSIPRLADKVRLLSISFDPEHDRPEVLERHARMVGAQPPLWTFAVAGHDELRRVAPGLGLTYGPSQNEIIHTLSTAVIAPDGRLVTLLRGRDWTVDDLLRALRDAANAIDEKPTDDATANTSH